MVIFKEISMETANEILLIFFKSQEIWVKGEVIGTYFNFSF